MIAIGLTGGIGSGKTTVAARFEARGAAVVDTDEISRSLTGAGGAALGELREAFGARFLGPDGALDRAAMRDLVFEDAAARALGEASGPYAIVVVPLLFETGGYIGRVARTLVVDCPERLQLERTAARSGLAPGEVRRIMAAQWPRWRRLQVADDVVWNGADAASIEPQCDRLHLMYASLADDPR